MLDLILFLKSWLVGAIICIPIGAVALLIIKKTLHKGKVFATAGALGSASADNLFGAVVVFGISFITSFLEQHAVVLQTGAALFIAFIGYRTFIHPVETHLHSEHTNRSHDFFQTFFLALSNPVTLAAIAGFLAAFDVDVSQFSLINALTILSGLFLGELCWWLLLIFATHYAGTHASARFLSYINKFAGATLFILSGSILARLVYLNYF